MPRNALPPSQPTTRLSIRGTMLQTRRCLLLSVSAKQARRLLVGPYVRCAPALIALGAEIETVGDKGGRRLAVEDLFTGNGLEPLSLDKDEIICAIIVPPRPSGFGWGYHKSTRRGGLEFAKAVIAVTLCVAADHRTCRDARIIIGAVRERPVRAVAAEQVLAGTTLDDASVAAAIAAAVEEINPLPHHGFTKSYIVDNIRVYLRRVLTRAARNARGEIETA